MNYELIECINENTDEIKSIINKKEITSEDFETLSHYFPKTLNGMLLLKSLFKNTYYEDLLDYPFKRNLIIAGVKTINNNIEFLEYIYNEEVKKQLCTMIKRMRKCRYRAINAFIKNLVHDFEKFQNKNEHMKRYFYHVRIIDLMLFKMSDVMFDEKYFIDE